jgi:hypothetical protein
MLIGGCFCGAVRYSADAPIYPPTLCHCKSCRRASGAHAVGWYTVPPSGLRYLAATPVERESSPGVFRAYCPGCFSPLTYRNVQRANEIDVTIASLDDPAQTPPADHIYMGDAAHWDSPADGLPQHSGTRPPRLD